MPINQTKARLGRLPKEGKELWIEIYDKDYSRNKDKERASRVAWFVVGKKYKKEESGKWMKRKGLKKKSAKRKTAKKKLQKRKIVRRNPLELDEDLVLSSKLFDIYFNKLNDHPNFKGLYKEARKNLLKTIVSILEPAQGELAAKYIVRSVLDSAIDSDVFGHKPEYSVKNLEDYLEEWDEKVY